MPSPLRFVLSRSTWLTPVVLVLGLAALFPAIYLSATADPQANLSGLPVGLVVEPQTAAGPAAAGPSAAGPSARDLASAIVDAVDSDAITLERMSPTQLATHMEHDAVAGAIVIPAGFTASVSSLLPGSVGPIDVADVRILTNAADGGVSSGLVTGTLTPALTAVQQRFGAQLVGAAGASGAPVGPADAVVLGTPFTIHASPYTPLPEKSGFATSAFYFSLVLVLLGFVGASAVNPLVDSALGFAPGEFGPLVSRRAYFRMSRRATLLAKFSVIVTVSPVAALVAQLVAGPAIGIPISDPVQLWLFSSAVIAAIGTSALTVFAIFGGGIGSIVNTVFFIALSMTSSGGTVPIEAVPPFFRWLATFEPFRAVIDAVRAIFYFDADPAAGLAEGWTRVAVGAAVGIALGLAVTTLYARNRVFSRHPRPATA